MTLPQRRGMKTWGHLKMAYFNNKKAQTLTEFAAFGSVLLLVLSFFISYGMRYNYQQDVQMRAFRTALFEAHKNDINNVNRPDASATVTLLEDKHIPDPRDMFGAGNVIPVQAGAQVTWGNTMQEKYNLKDDSSLPRMKYVLNDPNKGGKELEYRTAGYYSITAAEDINGQFYAILPGNTMPQLIPWTRLRCYQPTPESDKQAMILLDPAETDPKKIEKEVISEVYLPVGSTPYVKYQVIGVVPATASDGDPLIGLDLLSPKGGDINPNYTQLGGDTGELDKAGNPIYATPTNVQGLLLDSDQTIKRHGELTVGEDAGGIKTKSNYSFSNKEGSTTITHKIRTNTNSKPVDVPYIFKRGEVPLSL